MNEPGPVKRILLIEDNEDDMLLSLRLFEKCGVISEVQVARNGEEALDFAVKLAKDLKLILLDLNLPKIPGVEVLQRLQTNSHTRSIPVVVLTVKGLEKEALEKEPYHIAAYLRKPLELHNFLNLYQAHVRKL